MNSNILYSPFFKDIIEACSNIYRLGWGENHSGNLSYLLTENEVFDYLGTEPEIIKSYPLKFLSENLANHYFLITAAGSCFKNIVKDPDQHLGIIRINDIGNGFDVLWGYENNRKPTSELPTHLLCHNERLKTDEKNRLILHCHPTHTVAMTLLHDLDENQYIKTMWRINTESVIVFPEGIGVLPWMVCGNDIIGTATALKMREFRIVLWPYHGILAAGSSVDEALGLIEAVEKAAEIYMLTYGKIKQCLTDEQILELAEEFNLTIRKDIINQTNVI